MDFTNLPTLLHWIREREVIRSKKWQGLPKPWTTDPILRNYRFCNVRRQDDKVTKWIAENWYSYHAHPNFVGAITLSRLINEPSTLAYIGYPTYEWANYLNLAKEWRSKGNKVFNAAYIVSTAGEKVDKLDYVFRVAKDATSCIPIKGDTLASYAHRLTGVKGLGSGFLAAQIIADLKYTPWLNDVDDWWTWCLPGPGSLRGMNRLLGQDIDTRWTVGTFQSYVKALREKVSKEIGYSLHAQDIQNCLCEFSKYMKCLDGGVAKQRYPG